MNALGAFRSGGPSISRMARALILLAMVSASACTSGPERIYNLYHYRGDALSYLISSSDGKRSVPVHLSGNPFGIAPATLANISASAIQSAFPNRAVVFVSQRTDDARTDVAMRLAFDPEPGTTGNRLCTARRPLPSYPSSEDIHLVLAFCFGDRPMVGIEGRLDRGRGVGDAEFVTLLRDMARRMFEASSRSSL